MNVLHISSVVSDYTHHFAAEFVKQGNEVAVIWRIDMYYRILEQNPQRDGVSVQR